MVVAVGGAEFFRVLDGLGGGSPNLAESQLSWVEGQPQAQSRGLAAATATPPGHYRTINQPAGELATVKYAISQYQSRSRARDVS
jgi:hypothetical protein